MFPGALGVRFSSTPYEHPGWALSRFGFGPASSLLIFETITSMP
jgi:hypothetical protein